MTDRRSFLALTIVISSIVSVVTVTVAQRILRADDPKPSWRDVLTFEGTLSGTSRKSIEFAFQFYKNGSPCGSPYRTPADVADNDHFVSRIKLTDAALLACGPLFDGGEVSYQLEVFDQGTSVLKIGDSGTLVNGVPYALHADHCGSPDCPLGYTRSTTPEDMKFVVCKKGVDEVVKVGTGASAFWIDRYEATVFDNPAGSGAPDHGPYGLNENNDYGIAGFYRNGQWVRPLYALSQRGLRPSRFLTWFQAQEACHLSGKRLATMSEWTLAARGTPDPGAPNDGTNGVCVTAANSFRLTAQAGKGAPPTWCVSASGAEDMIGNAGEFTEEWFAAPGAMDTFRRSWPVGFPGVGQDYQQDATRNLDSSGYVWDGDWKMKAGVPVAAVRGGSIFTGTDGGVFYIALTLPPSSWDTSTGFRCVIPR